RCDMNNPGRDREGAKARRKREGRTFYMKCFSFAPSLRLCAFAVSSLVLVGGAGCRDIGKGGTGEMVVPESTFRDIKTVEPSEFASTPPTTAPSTLPTTRATTQPYKKVSLGIADVRRIALTNNLDLQVELYNPALARESL